jgi:pimeloyl-ACP methyl ester carboxylesterase
MRANAAGKRDLALLIHGLLGSAATMALLATRLRSNGIATHRWGYYSVGTCAEHLAHAAASEIARLAQQHPQARLHIVGHSLGSILARRALQLYRPTLLGRLVMLAPPNNGSHVATRLAPLVKRVLPLVDELSDQPASWVCQLASPEDLEFGVIAAARDAVVAPASAHLIGERDYVVCPGAHGMLIFRTDVARHVHSFLCHGHFAAAQPSPS